MNVDVDGDDDVLLMMRCYPSAYVNRNVIICNYTLGKIAACIINLHSTTVNLH